LRLGYVSSDFRDHATSYLLADILERHDRSSFLINAYSIGPDDHSAMRDRIRAGVDRFVDMYGIPSDTIAERIHADGVDILLDLNGYVQNLRPETLALRPAPVQVNYLGYPGTTGAPYMDFIIVDRFVVPPDQAPHFSERLAYLPDCYQPNDRARRIAADTPSRAACALPDTGFVFCAFNQAYKITPTLFDIWMRLLAATPASVLWLLETHPEASANLRATAARAGIDPQRLVFAPRLPLPDHLARHRLADLFLDTLPVNGHTTTSDALWAGLPVLTCAGNTFVSRVAGSLLHAVGLPDLVTFSLEDYEALARDLARDTARLAALRQRLATNRDIAPLFDSARYTRNLEALYHRMWDEYCRQPAAQAPRDPLSA
jgi:predicted O-linked N-acetylglucosamine transferase (SPINDLY family)